MPSINRNLNIFGTVGFLEQSKEKLIGIPNPNKSKFMNIIPKRIFGKSLEHVVYGCKAVINKYRGYRVVGRLTILKRNVGGDINVRKISLSNILYL